MIAFLSLSRRRVAGNLSTSCPAGYQAAETAAYALAADVQSDTSIQVIASELMTKHSGDTGDLADCMYGLAVG